MVVNKWFVALMQFVVAVIAGLQVARGDGIVTVVEQWQFGGLVVSSFGVVALPLLKDGYHAALKLIVALAGAGFAAIVPLVNNAWTFDSTLLVGLAVVNAALVHYGVSARIDGVKAVLADPKKDNQVVQEVDPVGVQVAMRA